MQFFNRKFLKKFLWKEKKANLFQIKKETQNSIKDFHSLDDFIFSNISSSYEDH